MVLRLLLRSEVEAAKDGISRLALGRRLRDGQTWVVEAGGTAAAALRFAFAAATALAAGFLLSLGLDAMVLIGKWEILLAMAFYTGVVWALVSPILLIPRSVAGVAKALERSNRRDTEARALMQSEETRTKIEKLQVDLSAADDAHAASRSRWPDWCRSQAAIVAEKKAAERVEELRTSLADLGAAEPASGSSVGLSRSGRALRLVSQLLYLAVLGCIGWLMIGPVAGAVLAALSMLLFLLARRFGVEAVLPFATVVLIVLGFSLGERFQDLPLSATIETDRGSLKARIIASTSTELIVLAAAGDGKRRSVVMVPRSGVQRVTIEPENGAATVMRLLPNRASD